MSSPEKIREDLEEIKSELGGMGERLKTSANEGNWHISPSAGGGGCMAHLQGTNKTCLILIFDHLGSQKCVIARIER